ncbi:hypothetical protein BSL78_21854 [Apostichopus japonicus]|uniref:Reverse transcriptase domain-containing protein n=1 Tax=Stichopus japonicus TaxID=307972 RepID=A0A2G8JZX5_STIJA|nr:hypothetical protein BSL78_21854 [Apostichopus japonicus]
MWHEDLLLKLRKYNIPIKLTRWISSFLSHCSTSFKIGSSFSSPLQINTGTPQGSTISPVLYILYVGDIRQPDNDYTKISQYADDITIWTSHIHPYRAEDYLQHYFNRIHWCKDWRIELNPKKSQILYIAKRNRIRTRQPYLTLNNTIIPVTNQVRFLGIHIDNRLKLGYQHRLNHRKVKQRVRLLFRIAGTEEHPLASPSTTMKIYKMMIRPLFEYAAPALAHIPPTTQNNLQPHNAEHAESPTNCHRI